MILTLILYAFVSGKSGEGPESNVIGLKITNWPFNTYKKHHALTTQVRYGNVEREKINPF